LTRKLSVSLCVFRAPLNVNLLYEGLMLTEGSCQWNELACIHSSRASID
jgi:hypothetical protein